MLDMRLFIATGVLSLFCGCTTVLYEGLAKPDSEVATLRADEGTYIAKIDGRDVPRAGFRRYKVLPGERAIAVGLSAPGLLFRLRSKQDIVIFVNAQAGHGYVTGPVISGEWPNARWGPRVIDEASGEEVGYFK